MERGLPSDTPPPSSPILPQDLSRKTLTAEDRPSNSSCSEESSSGSEEFGKYKCPGCEVTVNSQHALTLHIRNHNICEDGAMKCTICSKVLGSQASLDRHVLVHSGERPFKCRVCGVSFTTNGNMNRHLRSHCDSDSETERKRKLEFNNNIDEGKKKQKNDPFNCPQCEKEFISLHVLENHLEEMHPEYSAQCSECRLVFKSYRVLNLHRFMVHFKSEREPDLSLIEFSTEKFPLIAQAMTQPKQPFRPDDSQKDFFETLDLKKSPVKKEDVGTNTTVEITPPDSNSKEPDEEQDCFAAEFRKMKMKGEFPCRLCTAIFPNLRALKGHNRVHLCSTNSNFQCNMCPFINSDKSLVIRHMRTHNGDRPYECSLCKYAFTTKANCERHLRNRHSATKEDIKRSITYHLSEDECCKADVKRSLFPDVESDSESEMESEKEDAPLDLSMDALDLSKKKVEEPQDLSRKTCDINVPKVDLFYPNHFLSGFTPPFSPYYAHPVYYQTKELVEMKEKIQKELIRGLQLTGGAIVLDRAVTPEKPKKVDTPIKMVIKNGVLVPKQKQRRYRTERPFGCEHCSARFTLRSNMERHIKQQHPQFWSQRQRGHSTSRRPKVEEPDKACEIKAALAQSIKCKTSPTKIKEPEAKKDSDLASVSKLLDNASTQTFRQFFASDEDPPNSDEEGLVASHSEENSGSDEAKSEEGRCAVKKKSAYSLAPNRVSCPYCFRKFPWSSSLRRHVLTHTGQKPYKCTYCPLLFTTKSNCDRHLLRKHGGEDGKSVSDRPYKCDKCPSSTFSSQDALKRHVSSKHENLTDNQETSSSCDHPFKCHLCEGSFQERQEVLDHLQESHPSDYVSLLAKGALESSSCDDEPEDVSTGNDKKFPDYANRKVVCAFCVRRFWSAEDLRRHMRTHTGERPFSCDVCSRKFTLKHSMLRHKKKHDNSSSSSNGSPADNLKQLSENNNNEDHSSDLISNLLGIRDKTIIDKMIEKKSADDAALLLGINK